MTLPTKCIYHVSKWYLKTCRKKARKTLYNPKRAKIIAKIPKIRFLQKNGTYVEKYTAGHLRTIFEEFTLIYKATIAKNWVWPTFGCISNNDCMLSWLTSDKQNMMMSCWHHAFCIIGPLWGESTVYPKKYAHRFVVLCFVVVMQSFIMNSHEVFIHIHQGCFAGTGAIVRLPQCQWSKSDGYGKISQCTTTTKHSKAKNACIFLGIYCTRDFLFHWIDANIFYRKFKIVPHSIFCLKLWVKLVSNLYIANYLSWRRHEMEIHSTPLALCEGNLPVTSGLPLQWARDAGLWWFPWTSFSTNISVAIGLRQHIAHVTSM